MKYQSKARMIANPITPPTTPPAIAPVFELEGLVDPLDSGSDVVVAVAVAGSDVNVPVLDTVATPIHMIISELVSHTEQSASGIWILPEEIIDIHCVSSGATTPGSIHPTPTW